MTSNQAKKLSERLEVTHDNKFKTGNHMSPTSKKLTDQWLNYLSEQGKSHHTLVAYRRGLQHLVAWSKRTYEEAFDPAAVLPRDIERWKSYQVNTQKSAPATINQRLAAVSSFFEWCEMTDRITKSPTRSVRAIRLEKHRPRSITDTQLNRLLRAVRKGGNWRDMALIDVLAGTGIRVGELLALQVGDLVDLDKRSAHLIVRRGKNESYRTIPLTKSVRQSLADYLAQSSHRDDLDAPLWMGPRGPLAHSSSVLRLLDKYCIQARIESVTPHQLRHTFATRYLRKNPDDLRGLAALLGHRDLNTVMLYTEPSLDDLTHRMETLDEGWK